MIPALRIRIATAIGATIALSSAALGQGTFQGFTLPKNSSGKQEWREFKDEYITSDGRVIDDANGGISHSEGQGYGMLLAAEHRDLATFSVLWKWTRENLAVRKDGLFAWKWDPSRPNNPITDPNNATDGDILIAWALQRAGELWRNDIYISDAKRIARLIRTQMVVSSPRGAMLLPGAEGFRRRDGIVVNLSYWVFPAFLDFKRIDPSHIWDDLFLSGERLVRDARFGEFGLPPDWLLVESSGALKLPDGFDPVFGYNAVRVPLYLYWAGVDDPKLYEPFVKWAQHKPSVYQVPDQIHLESGQPGDYTVIPGMISIYHLIDPKGVADPRAQGGSFTSYYSACLMLLSNLAGKEHRKYSQLPHP